MRAWLLGFVVLLAAGAVPAYAMAATQFQPEAQTFWVKRTESLARIAGDGSSQLEGDVILANMKTSCEGLQGEQMSHEYGKVPRWALSSQIYACSAFGRWSGAGFLKTKVPCLDVQRGIDARKTPRLLCTPSCRGTDDPSNTCPLSPANKQTWCVSRGRPSL